MSQQNIDIINKVYDAFNSREYETVLSFFNPQMEWIAADSSPLSDKSPYHGIDAIREGVFGRIAAGFEKLNVRIDEIFAAENKVVVLGYYDGIPRSNGKAVIHSTRPRLDFDGRKAGKVSAIYRYI